MYKSKYDWHKLDFPLNNDIREALMQQHIASQFIALAGRYLIPQQPDDSNTNMQYICGKDMLIGNELPNSIRVGLLFSKLELVLLNKNLKLIDLILLKDKTYSQVFTEFKKSLASTDINTSLLKDELHYELPDHPLLHDALFNTDDLKSLQANNLIRSNAEIVLNEIVEDYPDAAPVRVWPHHFDTGTFIPIAFNDQGNVSKSLGVGLAIPDNMVNEPYYYLSFWSENNQNKLENMPEIEHGIWMLPEWDGAVLKHSEILKLGTADLQYNAVKSFFTKGIRILIENF